MKSRSNSDMRVRRHLRLRKKIRGSAERPRMSVFVSNRHMYVQFIDDDQGVTIAAVSTLLGERGKNDREAAKVLGGKAAEAAKEKGISTVVFDRGGFRFGGRIKELADAAREAGIQF